MRFVMIGQHANIAKRSGRRGEEEWVTHNLTKYKTNTKNLVVHHDHTGGLLSQRLAQCRLFHLHFVLPCHTHLDPVVTGGEQMLPLGRQHPAGVTKILKCAPEEAEDLAFVDTRTYARRMQTN